MRTSALHSARELPVQPIDCGLVQRTLRTATIESLVTSSTFQTTALGPPRRGSTQARPHACDDFAILATQRSSAGSDDVDYEKEAKKGKSQI